FPVATLAPAAMALFLPVQFSGSGGAEITFTPGKDRAISAVRSVEASSTTITSNGIPLCDTRDSRQEARHDSSLRAGTMTETMAVWEAMTERDANLLRSAMNTAGR